MPLLGQVPLVPELRAGSDSGPPDRGHRSPTARRRGSFADIAERIDVELAPKRVYHSELRIG